MIFIKDHSLGDRGPDDLHRTPGDGSIFIRTTLGASPDDLHQDHSWVTGPDDLHQGPQPGTTAWVTEVLMIFIKDHSLGDRGPDDLHQGPQPGRLSPQSCVYREYRGGGRLTSRSERFMMVELSATGRSSFQQVMDQTLRFYHNTKHEDDKSTTSSSPESDLRSDL
ncbi:unnamed protein product [Pleuronectes platessa]|uniref:Uncharacterized protein n=1 Tax=Pleuronectes platessa TaxID=8262 RepID=A0A9N7URY7_PLEPL|nr:unnamed protein product [Pleuronectes platessa]